ncbi:MAG: MATE family efflux transporter [Deltaproteobacteria bacterium]|nr:MATE family efflux transporter [Deltaproteobacteria bacterium]
MQVSIAPERGEDPTSIPLVKKRELSQLVRLASTLALIQVGYHLMGLVDTALAGRVGGETLAATGLGSAVFFAVTVLGIGLMLGLDPLVAQAFGALQPARARAVLSQGLYVAALVSLPLSLLILVIGALLPRFGIPPSLASLTYDYLLGRLPSLWLLLACVASRSYLQAAHRTRPVVVAVVLFNLVNFVFAWVLLFGDAGLRRIGVGGLGIEGFGVSGLAWASSIATFGQFVFMAAVVGRGTAPAADGRGLVRPDATTIAHVFGVGGPLGLQLAAETGVFALVGVLMGRMGTETMAAHQVALQLASITYAATLGIGAATSVQVGRAIGRGDVAATRFAGLAGIGTGASFMLATATVMWLFPSVLARLMTSDVQVIPGAARLISIAAVFQVADGVQSVAAGALRGAGVTRYSFVANLIGHWAIGAPLALTLAFGLGLGAAGLWWGLSAGLAVVAAALALRFADISRRPIARL